MPTEGERTLQKGITWLQLIATVIGLIAVLGGSAFAINLQVQRHEWWIQQHQSYTDSRIAEMKAKAEALDRMVERVARIEEKLDALRSELNQKGR